MGILTGTWWGVRWSNGVNRTADRLTDGRYFSGAFKSSKDRALTSHPPEVRSSVSGARLTTLAAVYPPFLVKVNPFALFTVRADFHLGKGRGSFQV